MLKLSHVASVQGSPFPAWCPPPTFLNRFRGRLLPYLKAVAHGTSGDPGGGDGRDRKVLGRTDAIGVLDSVLSELVPPTLRHCVVGC